VQLSASCLHGDQRKLRKKVVEEESDSSIGAVKVTFENFGSGMRLKAPCRLVPDCRVIENPLSNKVVMEISNSGSTLVTILASLEWC
jgi:hypothetical protein